MRHDADSPRSGDPSPNRSGLSRPGDSARGVLAGSEEQPELVVVEIKHVASKFGSELGSPGPWSDR